MSNIVAVKSEREDPSSPANRIPFPPPNKPDYDILVKLMARTSHGDHKAFARLYSLTSSKLFAFTVGIVGRNEIAEEVLQESYMKVWRMAHRFDPQKGRIMTWLMTIVRNTALTTRSKQARYTTHETSDAILDERPVTGPDPLDQAIMSSEGRLIQSCLQNLPPEQRKAIQLSYFNGATHSEIAEKLKIPLGTAKSRIRRGLLQLKSCMGDEGHMDIHEALAAEYAVGSLSPGLCRRFAVRRERDARYCGPAELWENRLAPLIETLADQTPPSRVWRSINDEIEKTTFKTTHLQHMFWYGLTIGIAASVVVAAIF